MWILATPVQFWVARRFYRSAWLGMKHRRFGMDFLVVLGTTVAYIASAVSVMRMAIWGVEAMPFFEASALLLTFVVMGKLLETMAKGKTTDALLKLMDMQPRTLFILAVLSRLGANFGMQRLLFRDFIAH